MHFEKKKTKITKWNDIQNAICIWYGGTETTNVLCIRLCFFFFLSLSLSISMKIINSSEHHEYCAMIAFSLYNCSRWFVCSFLIHRRNLLSVGMCKMAFFYFFMISFSMIRFIQITRFFLLADGHILDCWM